MSKMNECSLQNATIILCLLWTIAFVSINAFNVDTVNHITHEGGPDSMFGFSVALHQEGQLSW